MNRKITFKADSNVFISTVLYVLMVVFIVSFNTWFCSFLGTWIKNNGNDSFWNESSKLCYEKYGIQ